MTNASDLIAEIQAGLIEAAQETGANVGAVGHTACLEIKGTPGGTVANPTEGPKTYATLTILEDSRRERDLSGNTVGQVVNKLLVAAGGSVPVKGNRVAPGYTADDGATVPASDWLTIDDVVETAPAGVALLYEVILQS